MCSIREGWRSDNWRGSRVLQINTRANSERVEKWALRARPSVQNNTRAMSRKEERWALKGDRLYLSITRATSKRQEMWALTVRPNNLNYCESASGSEERWALKGRPGVFCSSGVRRSEHWGCHRVIWTFTRATSGSEDNWALKWRPGVINYHESDGRYGETWALTARPSISNYYQREKRKLGEVSIEGAAGCGKLLLEWQAKERSEHWGCHRVIWIFTRATSGSQDKWALRGERM